MFSIARTRRGFSLIELVIVVVIIGIIGAIAIPRMSRGAEGAADSARVANLTMLRSARDLFATEHGGAYPTLAQLPNALLQYSNDVAPFTIQATKNPGAGVIFGPYLRALPAVPVGAQKGQTAITDQAFGTALFGWKYDPATGAINANCTTEADVKGKLYNTY